MLMMVKPRRLTALICLLLLTSCSQTPPTSVEPGDGPAATSPAELNCASPKDETEETECAGLEEDGPTEEATEEPSDEPTEDAESPTASFKEKYTYADGVQVEVTKIRTGKLTKKDVEYASEFKAGQDYAVLTIRLRNGSKKTLDPLGSTTMTYGPDGEEAKALYILTKGFISGKIIPGRAKTADYPFLVPAKYQRDVAAEFGIDFEHESVVFSGSLK